MSQRERLAAQLQRVRKELDEVAGHVDTLAKALAEPEPITVELVGATEIATMAGVKASTIGVWVTRGKLPEPVAVLACGRVWAKSDIQNWLKHR